MKSKLSALVLLSLTVSAVLLYPKIGNSTRVTPPPDPLDAVTAPRIEVVFALDTTGSMSGLIDTAKEKIWSIANSMALAQNAPDIRIGLVAFRDRGDAYVTQVTDLSQDLDSVYAKLMDFEANGGGDTPESVNAALSAAVNEMSWSTDPATYRVVFLVGDAPPHKDYQDEPQYPETMRIARDRGIVVNTIRCGNNAATAHEWQQIASLTQGRYLSVEQAGGAIAMNTPFDEEIATLSRELDETRVAYGDTAVQALMAGKAAATEKLHRLASAAARARRAGFNALESGRKNLFGDHDLVEAIAGGDVKLDEVEEEHLPQSLRAMAPQERQDYVGQQAAKRKALNDRIAQVVATREAYIAEQDVKLEGSLDDEIFDMVKKQAEAKGMSYDEAAAPKL